VQILPPKHHQFTLSAPKRATSTQMKIAPGMEMKYQLEFKPISRSDCQIDLKCVTEREEFIIPVRAMGDAAFVDFPSALEFGTAFINTISRKPLLLRNTGTIPTRFTVVVDPPFSASPTHGQLDVHGSQQITVMCNPQVQDNHITVCSFLCFSWGVFAAVLYELTAR
jgi:hydrocephalus-inducing protein